MAAQKSEGIIPKKELIERIKADLAGRPPDVSTAMLIAASAFHGQPDRNHRPYVLHLMQVLLQGSKSQKKIIVGILHDLVEDKGWTLDDLREVGFAEPIIRAVDAVTHRDGEKYFDSIVRCGLTYNEPEMTNKLLAIDTKLNDLRHNMEVSRQTKFMTEDQLAKLNVYIVSYNYLVAIKTGEILPGTTFRDFMAKKPDLNNEALLLKNETPVPSPVPPTDKARTGIRPSYIVG